VSLSNRYNTIMYYVYLILCDDDSLYAGITNNIQRRLTEHKTKSGGRYTKLHRGIRLLYSEQFNTKEEAIKTRKANQGLAPRKKVKFNQIR